MKKYKLINNTLGWLIFIVAAATYLLTIEPTASYWDCPEFIAQAFKSEVGHPPGNPIFIMVGRLAACFAGGDVMAVSKCVNAMSALLSAATILLLFWTITHLVKKLVVKDGEEDSMTISQYLVVMGSGICGALAYTWSDTFWFSAVEAEVYAFSSFCTALVFWLILKWEDRADEPTSDRWIILIAYVFGFSLGVHLLNLLCIPAIALVIYYRKFKNTNVKGSIITLLVSFVAIVAILYGLEPGFVELGGYFDRFFVNVIGLPFNSGVVIYAVLLVAIFAWTIYEYYMGKNDMNMRISFLLSIVISGMLFIGDSLLIPLVLIVALAVYLFKYMKKVPVRLFSNIILSVFMIFIGFSCYSLIIIRSNANTPLDENSPNTMFGLSSYLSRDQYGKTPLLWGQVYTASSPQYKSDGNGTASTNMKKGNAEYAREVKTNPDDPDKYIQTGYQTDVIYPSEMCMFFPRIWSPSHADYYNTFLNVQDHPFNEVLATVIVDENGNPDTRFQQAQQVLPKPSFADNISFFLGYQMNYMYMRYFLWNFAGRQNDIQGLNCQMGDVTRGNWITGFNFIDNARLGDQSLLPDDYGKENKGHNVFYCLPLLLGIIGLLWQAFAGKKGIEQFWVIFFLFFMTGIAIVLYLNQPPLQPRERDYAYAGSFYAYAIWIGMGVAGIWRTAIYLMTRGKKAKNEKEAEEIETKAARSGASMAVAAVAAVIGLAVPLQMVSQTWDDHDRSNRYVCRDFGMNYLSSLDPNAIIFTNGDNDTFPLWYLQEVEGYRTDVRVVNLSYLATDWYIAQMQRSAYDSKPLPMQAGPLTFAYGNRQGTRFSNSDQTPVPADSVLAEIYKGGSADADGRITGETDYSNFYITIDQNNLNEAIKQGVISEKQRPMAAEAILIPFGQAHQGYASSSDMMALDIISSSIKQGWKRPVYFACTVDNRMYTPYSAYMQNTGMAYQITPLKTQEAGSDPHCNTDKMYKNVTTKFRWGGLDTPEGKAGKIYLDETARRMVNTTRMMLIDLAGDLTTEAEQATGDEQKDRIEKAKTILQLLQDKMPETACRYAVNNRMQMAQIYERIYKLNNDANLRKKAVELTEADIKQFAQYSRFEQALAAYDSETGANLSTCDMDRYIDENYVPQLFLFDEQINPDGYKAFTESMKKDGLNMNAIEANMTRIMNPQQQQMQQQMVQPTDTVNPEGEGEDQEGGAQPMGKPAGLPGMNPTGDEDEKPA